MGAGFVESPGIRRNVINNATLTHGCITIMKIYVSHESWVQLLHSVMINWVSIPSCLKIVLVSSVAGSLSLFRETPSFFTNCIYNQNVFTIVAFNHHKIKLCKNHANDTLYYVLQLISGLNIENLSLTK